MTIFIDCGEFTCYGGVVFATDFVHLHRHTARKLVQLPLAAPHSPSHSRRLRTGLRLLEGCYVRAVRSTKVDAPDECKRFLASWGGP